MVKISREQYSELWESQLYGRQNRRMGTLARQRRENGGQTRGFTDQNTKTREKNNICDGYRTTRWNKETLQATFTMIEHSTTGTVRGHFINKVSTSAVKLRGGHHFRSKHNNTKNLLLQGEAQGLALNEKKVCNQKLCWATPTEANMPTPPCHEVQCRGWHAEEPSL